MLFCNSKFRSYDTSTIISILTKWNCKETTDIYYFRQEQGL